MPSVDRGRFREIMWPGLKRKEQKARERALGLKSNKERGAYLIAQGKIAEGASKEEVRDAVREASGTSGVNVPSPPVIVVDDPPVAEVGTIVDEPEDVTGVPSPVLTASPSVVVEDDASMFEKLKAKAQGTFQDLRQEAIASGANTVPMTGAAIGTLDTPADSVVSRVLPTAIGVVGGVALGAGGVAVAREVKKRRAAKKAGGAKAKKRKARKASRARRAKAGGKKRAGRGRRTWHGKPVHHMTVKMRGGKTRKQAYVIMPGGKRRFVDNDHNDGK